MFNLFKRRRRRARRSAPCSPISDCLSRMSPVILTAALSLLSSAGGSLAPSSLLSASGQQQPFQQLPVQQQTIQPMGGPSNTVRLQESPLDQPLRMLADAKTAYAQVHAYQCLMISQERVHGNLLPQSVAQMIFRQNPFSVYMKWLAPNNQKDQEVCYEFGRNQNMMKVLPAGIGKGFGWMSIAVDDPKVMQHSRHTIVEAGFGNWLDRFGKCWQAERVAGKTQVKIADYNYNNTLCTRVETFHPQRDASTYCCRSVLYFDKTTRLPIRMECYDWPRQGGPPEGDLLESFSYINIQFNIGVTEAMFTR